METTKPLVFEPNIDEFADFANYIKKLEKLKISYAKVSEISVLVY